MSITVDSTCGGVEYFAGQCKVWTQTGTDVVRCTKPIRPEHDHPAPVLLASCLYNECWVCVCANTIDSDGFYPCDPVTGEEIEPTLNGPWDGKSYRCGDCGRIIDQSTSVQHPSGVWTVTVTGYVPTEVTA